MEKEVDEMNKLTRDNKFFSKQSLKQEEKEEINVENPVEKARRQIASQETTGVTDSPE